MRFDLQIIASWIEPGARVLDLGCGRGDLLDHLKREKGVTGRGVEIEEGKVLECISRGLSVVQGDINREIEDYPDRAFDYVVLSQTLQQVYDPAALAGQMLRVGARAVVSFPNFGHWRIRAQMLFTGSAPKTSELPFDWHDTPNIRVITLQDFRRFCRAQSIPILEEAALDTDYHDEEGHILSRLRNLRAKYGIFLLGI